MRSRLSDWSMWWISSTCNRRTLCLLRSISGIVDYSRTLQRLLTTTPSPHSKLPPGTRRQDSKFRTWLKAPWAAVLDHEGKALYSTLTGTSKQVGVERPLDLKTKVCDEKGKRRSWNT